MCVPITIRVAEPKTPENVRRKYFLDVSVAWAFVVDIEKRIDGSMGFTVDSSIFENFLFGISFRAQRIHIQRPRRVFAWIRVSRNTHHQHGLREH